MNKQIIECVPNFSEGRDLTIIKQITDEIEGVDGITLLDVDPGKATNRTVVTFVGAPDAVVEAAYRGIKKAAELIDMSRHQGEHPRMGATDVCPLIPIADISMAETVEYARKLAERVGNELEIPVYLYEEAATKPERKNLATIRAGEYEGFAQKITKPEWQPDFGTAVFNPKSGATVIGARDFLIAYNVNLNTKSTRKANAIAFDVREQGRIKRKGDPISGEIERDELGNPLRIPGTLKAVKAIGWFIDEYDISQISMNLTDYKVTSVHQAFEEVENKARERGIRVTGSEIVGMVPLKVMLEAGKHFLTKQGRSVGVPEEEIIHIAIKSLGLNELSPFIPEKRIIEYAIKNEQAKKLIKMNLREFANETSSESPAPGGGSVASYVGALGISLAAMVANISAGKRGWEEKIENMSEAADKAQLYKDQLLAFVDEDTNAFNKVMNAFSLPKNNDLEKSFRNEEIQKATKYALEVPLKVMETALASMEIIAAMAENGNPNSVSDAGVGVLCARTAVRGAWLNVKINATGISDQSYLNEVLARGTEILQKAEDYEQQIIAVVMKKIG